MSFALFIKHLLKAPLETFDDHWKPQYFHCQPNLIRYDAIFKVESLAEDIQKFFHKSIPIKNMEEKPNSDSILDAYFKDIAPGDIAQLYQIYKEDFRFFHYVM